MLPESRTRSSGRMSAPCQRPAEQRQQQRPSRKAWPAECPRRAARDRARRRAAIAALRLDAVAAHCCRITWRWRPGVLELGELAVDLLQPSLPCSLGRHVGVGFDLDRARADQLELADRHELRVARRAKPASCCMLLQDLLLARRPCRSRAKKSRTLLLGVGVEVLAPHQRVARDQRRASRHPAPRRAFSGCLSFMRLDARRC